MKPGETGVFLETAHPAKFLETVEGIIGEAVEIPAKAAGVLKGEEELANDERICRLQEICLLLILLKQISLEIIDFPLLPISVYLLR